MSSELQSLLDDLTSAVHGDTFIIICQTFSYGIYLCLVPIAIHAMVINGLQSRARKWLLAIIAIIFALMTVHWTISVVFTFISMDLYDDAATTCYGNDNAFDCLLSRIQETYLPVSNLLGLINSVPFVNFIIADGIIIWRAWVLCSDQSRVVLMIPVVMLAINTVAYLTIVTAWILNFTGSIYNNFGPIVATMQMAHMALSLLVNIFATSIIALKAWKYRKLLIDSGIGIRTPRQAIRILALLVESGLIYILISVTIVTLMAISMRFGLDVVLNIFVIVGMQLVGIYPIAVVILVEKNRSLDSALCSFGTIIDVRGDRVSQVEPMTFASGPVLASGGQVDLATKPPSSSTHATFDLSLEPREAGMGT